MNCPICKSTNVITETRTDRLAMHTCIECKYPWNTSGEQDLRAKFAALAEEWDKYAMNGNSDIEYGRQQAAQDHAAAIRAILSGE